MVGIKINLVILSVICCDIGIARADPCFDYMELNDTTLTTDYIAPDIANITCPTFKPLKWYRYTGTDDGLLTNQCPTGLQCGSNQQVWINDTFPTVDEGERLTKLCIHTGSSCCSATRLIKMKNCTNYMVYFLIPTPKCTNYCFQSTQPSTSPSSTPYLTTTLEYETTTVDQTVPTTTEVHTAPTTTVVHTTPTTTGVHTAPTTTVVHTTPTTTEVHTTPTTTVVHTTPTTTEVHTAPTTTVVHTPPTTTEVHTAPTTKEVHTTRTTSVSNANNADTNVSDDNEDKIFGLDKWIVIVIGSVVGGVIMLIIVICVVKSRKR
ncbi:hypothetical protein ACF0H5_015270 [Mactra antiquata]